MMIPFSPGVVLPMLVIAFMDISISAKHYDATWASLDTRPLPTWYDEAKFGIFLHWGVFSVPSFGGAWFWYDWIQRKSAPDIAFMKHNYRHGFTYADFAAQFKAEFYDPDQWADIFQASGAKYVVLTSKHHEGFCNWPSKVSFNWNSMDVGPKRDLVGDLATAIRNRTKLHFGVYHSLFEWFNPAYLQDKSNNFKTQNFVKEKTMPELYELVQRYKPDVVWSDGQWEANSTYWDSTKFIAWLYNESPVKDTVVINDRWGSDTSCLHGGVYTCQDRYNPGHLIKHKWENCMTVDKEFWAFRRNMELSDIFDVKELIGTLAETVSCGGNLLMNVGPTADGRIIPIFEERLRQMGSWLKINGDAIYSSKSWKYQNDTATSDIWYTSKPEAVYAIVLDWPSNGILYLAAPKAKPTTAVTMLGVKLSLKWQADPSGGLRITMPGLSVKDNPSQWAWVLKMTNIG